MKKITIDKTADDLHEALDITPQRAKELDALCGIITEELNTCGHRQREVSNLDFLAEFLHMAQTEQERVYLAYMAAITVTEQFPV